MAKPYSRCRQRNALVTGYPGIDNLQYGIRLENNLWKDDDITKKRIIWAPHHTIDFRERVGFSCFLRYYETMIDIAKEFEDRIQVSFKPHPLLKNKLYDHPQWGREVTDQYYRRWEELDNGQVNTDDYVDLFNSSDALIHDSGSFVAEYLSCGKPALFTISDDSVTQRFNEFGKIALDRYYQAFNESDIESFVELVIGEREDTKRNERDEFYKTYLLPKNSKKASVNIFEDICREVFLK